MFKVSIKMNHNDFIYLIFCHYEYFNVTNLAPHSLKQNHKPVAAHIWLLLIIQVGGWKASSCKLVSHETMVHYFFTCCTSLCIFYFVHVFDFNSSYVWT